VECVCRVAERDRGKSGGAQHASQLAPEWIGSVLCHPKYGVQSMDSVQHSGRCLRVGGDSQVGVGASGDHGCGLLDLQQLYWRKPGACERLPGAQPWKAPGCGWHRGA
jgi:hypothetical protein